MNKDFKGKLRDQLVVAQARHPATRDRAPLRPVQTVTAEQLQTIGEIRLAAKEVAEQTPYRHLPAHPHAFTSQVGVSRNAECVVAKRVEVPGPQGAIDIDYCIAAPNEAGFRTFTPLLTEAEGYSPHEALRRAAITTAETGERWDAVKRADIAVEQMPWQRLTETDPGRELTQQDFGLA